MAIRTKRLRSVREGKKPTKKRCNFTLYAPEASTVYVVGDFNGWNQHSHPLKKDSKGTWKTSITLTPGRYEYRFLVDREWCNDPHCITFVPNTFGSENCIITVK